MTGSRRALLVIDVQNDFCEGGSLAVAGGSDVARRITDHVQRHADDYLTIAATADWHEDPGGHFSPTPDFVDTWPPHCRVGTPGADFHDDVVAAVARAEAIFRKGRHQAAYSGFEGYADPQPSGEGGVTGLEQWLRDRRVDALDIVGIATDHCVRATALDAVRAGFETRVLLDLTAGVAPETTSRTLDELRSAGVQLLGEPVMRA